MNSPSFLYRSCLVFGHAIFMMLICWVWLSLDFNLEVEEQQAKTSIILKRTLLSEKRDYTDDFVFIDVSAAKKLIPREEGPGYDVITDRAKLDTFFQLVNRPGNNNYSYIICDLLFDHPSGDDRALEKSITAAPRVIIPYILDETGLTMPLFTKVEKGFAGYHVSTGYNFSRSFLRYNLIEEGGLKSIPAIVYEHISQSAIQKKAGLVWMNGKTGLNNMVLDLRIRNQHLPDSNEGQHVIPLDDVLNMRAIPGAAAFGQFWNHKIIIIGDFERDLHETVLGEMPGSFILANIFLSIREGDNIITWKWLFYLLICFVLVSWLFLFPPLWLHQVRQKIRDHWLGMLVREFLGFGLLLWIISFCSFLIFDRPVDIVILSVYLSLGVTIKELLKKRQNLIKKSTMNWLLLLFPFFSFQKDHYYITFIKGEVTRAQTPKKRLRLGDEIFLTDSILFRTPDDRVAMICPAKGQRFIIRPFKRPRPDELGEFLVTVIDNLFPATTFKNMIGRGGLISSWTDAETYFTQFSSDSTALLVLDSTLIPLSRQSFNNRNTNFFFIRYHYNKGEVNMPLSYRENLADKGSDTIFFVIDEKILSPGNTRIKEKEISNLQLLYYYTEKKESRLISPFQLKFMHTAMLLPELQLLYDKLKERYGNNNGRILDELYSHVTENYGFITRDRIRELMGQLKN